MFVYLPSDGDALRDWSSTWSRYEQDLRSVALKREWMREGCRVERVAKYPSRTVSSNPDPDWWTILMTVP